MIESIIHFSLNPLFLKPNAVLVKGTKNLGAGAKPSAPRSSANALAGAKAFVTTKAESAHGSRRSHPLVTMSASRSQLWAPAVNSG